MLLLSSTIRQRAHSAAACTALLVCCVLLPSGCKKNDKADTADAGDNAVAVTAQHPTLGPIAEQITADAILAPLTQAAIAPRISAPIKSELVQRGAHVRKGQLLLTLEDRDLQGTALDTRGGVTAAQAAYTTATEATIPENLQKAQLDVDQARANLEVANRTAEERKRLLREGAIAGRDTDTAVAAAVQAQAAYDTAVKHLGGVQNTTQRTDAQSAQGALTSAQGRLASAAAQVSYASLRSPISGVVTDRPLFPGETASAGTSVITVMDTSSLLAKLHIAQATAQQLRLGATAEVRVPGLDEPQAATVAFISPALDPGSTTVEVWLKLPNADGRYCVGTAVHAVIRGKPTPNAIQVPPGAILPADDGTSNVLVVGPDGTAHKRAVIVGMRTPDTVQITSGVSVEDNVITEGGYGLDDGTKVKLGGADADDEKNKGDNKDKDDDSSEQAASAGKAKAGGKR